jgi:hypothetical protein
MIATIRNYPPETRRECPCVWDRLCQGDGAAIRHCGRCDRPVHLCLTDEETVANARAGHIIARRNRRRNGSGRKGS